MDRPKSAAFISTLLQVSLNLCECGRQLTDTLGAGEHRYYPRRTLGVTSSDRLGRRVSLHQPFFDTPEDSRTCVVTAGRSAIQRHRQRQVLSHARAQRREHFHNDCFTGIDPDTDHCRDEPNNAQEKQDR